MLFKIVMLLFFVLLVIFKLVRVSIGLLSIVLSVIKILLEFFILEDIKEMDFIVVEELVCGFIFDKYNERIIIKESKNIKLIDFVIFVSRIVICY